jgi:hypothetical protein
MNLIEYLMDKSREKKHQQFVTFCNPKKMDLVLDVGVQDKQYKASDNFFEQNYPYKKNITALGVEELTNFSKRYPNVKAVTYDGKFFPFDDGQFDFVWSNAVVEHVGGFDRQLLFISELIRVAKKKIVFTTPDRCFPFEIHTRLPLVHWFPRNISNWFYIKSGNKFAAGDYMYLLTKKDLVKILDKIKKKNNSIHFEIKKNRIFGFSSTFTVLINKK